MIDLVGGSFPMGSTGEMAYPDDGEGPVHDVELSPFRIDPYAVSNARFAEFVDATGFVTEAQRFGWSFVFAGLLPDDFPDTAVGRQRAVVAAGVRGRLGASRRARSPTSTDAPTTRSSTCRGPTPRRSVSGAGPACPPRRSGSTPPPAVRVHGVPLG